MKNLIVIALFVWVVVIPLVVVLLASAYPVYAKRRRPRAVKLPDWAIPLEPPNGSFGQTPPRPARRIQRSPNSARRIRARRPI